MKRLLAELKKKMREKHTPTTRKSYYFLKMNAIKLMHTELK